MSGEWVRCEGSSGSQVVDWDADKDYPGASVCIYCTYGVMLVRGTISKGVSVSGREGDFGRLRVHYVKWDKREPVRMAYKKPKGLKG